MYVALCKTFMRQNIGARQQQSVAVAVAQTNIHDVRNGHTLLLRMCARERVRVVRVHVHAGERTRRHSIL